MKVKTGQSSFVNMNGVLLIPKGSHVNWSSRVLPTLVGSGRLQLKFSHLSDYPGENPGVVDSSNGSIGISWGLQTSG